MAEHRGREQTGGLSSGNLSKPAPMGSQSNTGHSWQDEDKGHHTKIQRAVDKDKRHYTCSKEQQGISLTQFGAFKKLHFYLLLPSTLLLPCHPRAVSKLENPVGNLTSCF